MSFTYNQNFNHIDSRLAHIMNTYNPSLISISSDKKKDLVVGHTRVCVTIYLKFIKL